MQVNVFISEGSADKVPALLVLPNQAGAVIPRHLQGISWRHFAITTPEDKLLGADADAIRGGISVDGYVVVQPTW